MSKNKVSRQGRPHVLANYIWRWLVKISHQPSRAIHVPSTHVHFTHNVLLRIWIQLGKYAMNPTDIGAYGTYVGASPNLVSLLTTLSNTPRCEAMVRMASRRLHISSEQDSLDLH
jgi:hypothetical protein